MKPRDYQLEAAEKITAAIKINQKVGAVMPTGSGKSLVETMVIDNIVDDLTFNQCVLVVCHITDVVDQLSVAYGLHGKHGKKALRLAPRIKPRVPTKVIFCTIQMLVSEGARKFWTKDPMRKEVTHIIIDEAHQFGTDGYETLHSDLFPFAKIIGFSATPYRRNQYSFSQFDVLAYSIDTKTLIQRGFLCPPKLFTLNMEEMDSAERYAAVIKIFLEKERERGLVSVVYLRSRNEAQEMQLVAEEAGVKVAFISGESSQTECRELYAKARSGDIEMICNVKKLETGIDIPGIGAIFMPFGTNSVVTYLQRIGRALRPFTGKREAHVYVFGDAPSVEGGKWQRIQRDALEARDPLDPLLNLEDELLDLIEEGAPAARIAWTREAIKACELLLAGNMKSVAELISEKRFPDKYSKALAKLAPMIKDKEVTESVRIPISEAQISILSLHHKFRHEHIKNLSIGEAGAIIGALSDYFARDAFILQQGPFAGTHIADTPPMYRRHIKDRENLKLWKEWIRAGRPDGDRNAS